MAARRPFWKRHRWKSIGFCLWPPSTCIWSLKLKFQSKLDLCSGNHVVYRQTDGQTDRRTRWIQYTPPPTSLGGGINIQRHHLTDSDLVISYVISNLDRIEQCCFAWWHKDITWPYADFSWIKSQTTHLNVYFVEMLLEIILKIYSKHML